MGRTNLLPGRPNRPETIERDRALELFCRWLDVQIADRRAGKRAFLVTTNSAGEITAVEGHDPPERLA